MRCVQYSGFEVNVKRLRSHRMRYFFRAAIADVTLETGFACQSHFQRILPKEKARACVDALRKNRSNADRVVDLIKLKDRGAWG